MASNQFLARTDNLEGDDFLILTHPDVLRHASNILEDLQHF